MSMNPFWTVVGRACCEADFRSSCYEKSRGRLGPQLPPLHQELRDFRAYVVNQKGHHLDNYGLYYFYDLIWELKDAFSNHTSGPVFRIGQGAESSGVELKDPVGWEVLGLACTDRVFRAALHQAAGDAEAFRKELEEETPPFVVGQETREALRKVFQSTALMEDFEATHELAWRIPYALGAQTTACNTALRHDHLVFIRQDIAIDLWLLYTEASAETDRSFLRDRLAAKGVYPAV